MCSSVLQRALAAPLVWILLALLDGKCFVCAFSSSVDPEKFLDFANMTSSQVQLFLAKVPCKEDELVRDSPARKAVSRYLRCLSQVIQWFSLSPGKSPALVPRGVGKEVQMVSWGPSPLLETQARRRWSLEGSEHAPHTGHWWALRSGHFAFNTNSPQGRDQVPISSSTQLVPSPEAR